MVDFPGRLDRLQEAVDKGGFDNPGELVNVAIENQIELELGGVSNEELVEINNILSHGSGESSEARTTSPSTTQSPSEFEANNLDLLEYDSVTTVSPPDSGRLDSGPLWGQYNRIFPVKIILRCLANRIQNEAINQKSETTSERLLPLSEFSEQVAEIARQLGLRIETEDQKQSRGQGEKLSAALPIGDDPEKSKQRFQTHFIGHAEQGGDLTGAAPHLLFVSMPVESQGRIGITQAGLEFATITNPLIDDDLSSGKPLSNSEVEFYIQHVAEQRPAEFSAMRLIARAILDGDDRPKTLTKRVSSINNSWSDSQAQTVRSGLVSRMFELGLVRRERIGQRGIIYKLTDGAEGVLNSHE